MTPALAKVTVRPAENKKDYAPALNYLKKYKDNVNYAQRKKQGDPIGSGVTEAGCKVIFGQRLKQSGMLWHRETGQHIVDLRTANRSGIWQRIWKCMLGSKADLPPISYRNSIRSTGSPMNITAARGSV